MDRGSDTIIAENGYNTEHPLHIDQSQMLLSPDIRYTAAEHFTSMTFFVMECECAQLVRYLNFVQASTSSLPTMHGIEH